MFLFTGAVYVYWVLYRHIWWLYGSIPFLPALQDHSRSTIPPSGAAFWGCIMSSTFCLLKKKPNVGIQNLSSENPRDVHFLWQVFTDFASFGSFSRKKFYRIVIFEGSRKRLSVYTWEINKSSRMEMWSKTKKTSGRGLFKTFRETFKLLWTPEIGLPSRA